MVENPAGDGITGLPLPDPVDPGSFVEYHICVPNAWQYRSALVGAISELCKYWNWEHTQDDISAAQQAAFLFKDAVDGAGYEEACMTFCERLIECLNNDTDVQAAIANLIATNPAIRAALSDFVADHPNGTQYPINQQLPSGAAAANILPPNPECDPDILWSQCIGIVQTANRMVLDFMETWETYTNAAETIPAIIGSIPFLGEVADVAGLDAISAYANSLIDSIHENYAADYTLEYEQELACEIFCAAKADCVVSIDMLCGILNARLSGQLNLANGLELMLSLIDADISGINVADLYLCAFFNMLKLANLVLPITWGIEAYLTTIAVFNEPSDDWQVLCTECPDPCGPAWETITWYEGTVLAHTGDDWDIRAVLDTLGAPNYVIRNTEYGDFSRGNYVITGFDFLSSGTITQVYVESPSGTPAGFTSIEDANAACPMCVRFVQIYRPAASGAFDVRFGIDNS